MTRYLALLDGEPGAFGIVFPDCPGCAAMGDDEADVYANAIDALGEWVGDASAGGGAPPPRSLEVLRDDAYVQEALAEGAVFISIPLVREYGRSIKANISLDLGLLEAIDAAAKQSRVTRSAFLAGAARDKIFARG